MKTPVKVIYATCSADFSESDIVVVGKDGTAVNKALEAEIARRWTAMKPKDKLFYNDLEHYFNGWYARTFEREMEL